ncbi:MAG: hypothetical protein JSW47_01200 [Phycisphaerales bacterium]|nr:MAG: hypothetical protein JSW47_01200 [Phycisphaerales bacterium]
MVAKCTQELLITIEGNGAMIAKYVLSLVVLLGTVVAICGCQGELCPEAKRLAEEARSLEPESNARLERLKAAIDSYRQCRKAREGSKSARMAIDEEVKNLTGEFASLRLAQISLKPPRTVAQYDEVISKLDRVLSYDDANESLLKALGEYRSKKKRLVDEVRRFLTAAADKRSARQWQEAVSSVDSALAIDPENEEAGRTRREILLERDAHYEREIQESCRSESFDGCQRAVSLLRALEEEKPHPDRRLIAKLQSIVESTRENVTERLLGQKRYFSACALVKGVNTPKARGLFDIVVDQGGPYYMALADKEHRSVRDFHAYVAAFKAMELLGLDNTQAFALHRDCADRVDDSIQIKIGLAAFESSQDETDIGRSFSNELVTYLYPLLPYGIKIEEREKIEFAIEKVGSTDVVRLLGLKWAVFGDVQCKVVRERDERTVTTWTLIPKTIANPHYETELRLMQESGKGKSTLPEPKPTILSKVSEKVTYSAGEERLHGQIEGSARIYSAGEGYVMSPKSFETSKDVNDLFCDEVPDANILGDPLQLPPELTLVQEMRDKAVKEVGDWLLSNFGPRQRLFFEETDYFIQRQEWDHAVRAAVQGYLYCLRDNVAEDDQWFRQLRQLALFDLTEGSTL